MVDAGFILALNSGSSSLKIGCYLPPEGNAKHERQLFIGSAEGIGSEGGSLRLQDAHGATLSEQQHLCETQEQALQALSRAIDLQLGASPAAIGHRIVHGGPKLREHQRITPQMLDDLKGALHLAPLHVPQAIRLIEQTTQLYPDVPQFACFDTTFHRTLPPVASHLPVPATLFSQGVQRYGFHGLSCESVMRRLGEEPPARVVIAHLGNGCSVTAVHNGASIDTTMGLSPTGGIPMSTRSGDLDPAVLLYLLRTEQLSTDALEQYVNKNCGLAGVSGGKSDMQQLLERACNGDSAASLTTELFCTSVRKVIGSYAALLGGIDALVFTGGIGEHSQEIRDRITHGLDFLFSSTTSKQIAVLPAAEEIEIAYHCRRLLLAS